MDIHPTLARLQGGLVVSCQALEDEPLHGAHIMAAMARAALMGGAVGIRANSPADVSAIRAALDLPLIGLYKANIPGFQVFITPTVRHAVLIAEAGADILALDATLQSRPDGLDSVEMIRRVKEATGKLVLADVATYEEGSQPARPARMPFRRLYPATPLTAQSKRRLILISSTASRRNYRCR